MEDSAPILPDPENPGMGQEAGLGVLIPQEYKEEEVD